MKIRKKKCSHCENDAVWFYMPSSNGMVNFCDECVPRGCTCNVHNIEEFVNPTESNIMWWNNDANTYINGSLLKTSKSFYFEQLDEKGRRFPCCEYDYDENGWKYSDNIYGVLLKDIEDIILNNKYLYKINEFMRKDILIMIDNIKMCENNLLDYSKLMSQLINVICKPYSQKGTLYETIHKNFINSIKNALRIKKELMTNNSLID